MRVTDPDQAEDRLFHGLQPVGDAAGVPDRRVVFRGEGAVPRRERLPSLLRGRRLHEPQTLATGCVAVAIEPARVMEAERRWSEAPAPRTHGGSDRDVVAEQHKLDVLEPGVGPGPLGIDERRAL